MPLIVICGHPCSGKSTVAQRIAEICRQRGGDAVVVDEESLHLVRNDSYKGTCVRTYINRHAQNSHLLPMYHSFADVPSEKNTRGVLRSVVDRCLSQRSRIVIFDSLNNIKGYRYELWCIARGASTRYCMVHVDTFVDVCRQWNTERRKNEHEQEEQQEKQESCSYSDEIFEDLASRFERPDARNKWDAPLFTVRPEHVQGPNNSNAVDDQVSAIVTAMMTESSQEATRAAVAVGAAVSSPAGIALSPTFATTNSALTATNLLHDIDKAMQSVLDTISEAQAAAGPGPPGAVAVDGDGSGSGNGNGNGNGSVKIPPLYLPRQVTLGELRRHKRTFLKMTSQRTWNTVNDVYVAKRMFVDFLRAQVV